MTGSARIVRGDALALPLGDSTVDRATLYGGAHFQAVMARQRHERAVLIEPLRVVVDGVTYDCTRPTEHQAGVHRLIRHYRRTDVPVVVGVAS